MQHPCFGHDNDFARRRIFAERDHFFGRTNFVRQHPDRVGAFGMRDDRRARIFFANPIDAARGELDVHVTSPLPQIHFAPGPFHHPRAEVLVRNEQDLSIFRRRAHDLVRVAAGANDVGLRFYAGAAIDVSDDVIILISVSFQKLGQFFGRTRFGKRTTGFEIGQNHSFGRVNDLRRLRHEMNAAKKNDVGTGLGGLVTQA